MTRTRVFTALLFQVSVSCLTLSSSTPGIISGGLTDGNFEDGPVCRGEGRRYLLCRLIWETEAHVMGTMRFRCLPSFSPGLSSRDLAHISSISMAKASIMTASGLYH